MKITLNKDQELLILNNESNAVEVIGAVNKLIGKELIFSHLVIDDLTIYSDHESYIEKYINDMKVINIIAKTKTDHINDTLLTTESYLKNSYIAINDLIEQFYNVPTEESWNIFKQLTEGIQWLIEMIVMIDQLKERPTNWQRYVDVYHQLEQNIPELADAIESQDSILIADVINYEIKPLFETLQHLITNTIDQEGSRPHAN